jgi:AcrR family transcriptional regulator
VPEHPNRDRADRILDAAAQLLGRLGYRKVTIEDIARQAGIGKGTIYLHWRTKDLLFEALLLRETAGLFDDLLDPVRANPDEIMPHRFVQASYLAAHRRPVIAALVTGDAELLGKLHEHPLRGQDLLATERYFELMQRDGFLRDDVPNLRYAMQASAIGFYLPEAVLPDSVGIGLESKAAALAHTIRHAFEPAKSPSVSAVKAAATELTNMFEELITGYRKWVYANNPAPEGDTT